LTSCTTTKWINDNRTKKDGDELTEREREREREREEKEKRAGLVW
jgi:hypothetical protein